jgi:hypothetical protein
MTNLSYIIAQLERAWQDIQFECPDLPDAVITSSRRRQRSENNVVGQYCANVWKVGDEHRAEITIFGERLLDGSEQVMQTLLHEAAHALAKVRDIKDTSNKGRFHNKKFVKLAEELGLEGPAESGGTALGFSDCEITASTADKYTDTIKNIESVLSMYVSPLVEEEEEKPKKPTQKAACECPSEKDDGEEFNTITWAKWMQKKLDTYGTPPLLCGLCRQAFTPTLDIEDE